LRPPSLGHFKMGPFGQHFQRLRKADVFTLHDERETVAAFLTRPAFKRFAVGVNHHGGVVIVMKRAQPREFTASVSGLQRYAAFRDQPDDVGAVSNQFFELIVGNERHAQRSSQLQNETMCEPNPICKTNQVRFERKKVIGI